MTNSLTFPQEVLLDLWLAEVGNEGLEDSPQGTGEEAWR